MSGVVTRKRLSDSLLPAQTDTQALVDPKTKEWIPRGRLAQWQPRVDHVAHLLHALKASFKTAALDAITEEQAVNKQVWS